MNLPGSHQAGQLGQVAVGKYILRIGPAEGAYVYLGTPTDQAIPLPRPAPVMLRPRRFTALLDRETEIGLVQSTLQSDGEQWLQFYGSPGVGKTSLLRYLAYHPLAAGYRDGVVYLNAARQPFVDLLSALFQVFNEFTGPALPDEAEIRQGLQGRQAFILIDDCDLPSQEVASLLEVAPGSSFLFSSVEPLLWREGHAVALAGLPVEAAPALFEGGLGRPLTGEERSIAQELCAELGGHPLHVLQSAALVRQDEAAGLTKTTLAALRESLVSAGGNPAEALYSLILANLGDSERQVVFTLAALEGAMVPPDHLAILTGQERIGPVLEGLSRKGVVKGYSGGYSLAGSLSQAVLNTWDLTGRQEHALGYFIEWAEAQQGDPVRLQQGAGILLGLLSWASGTGRWPEVLHLARQVEGALALGGRWGTWLQALQMARVAAQSLEGRAAQAWALHQLGTRALLMGEDREARVALIQALRLRESLHDEAGAAATKHNLDVLLSPQRQERAAPTTPVHRDLQAEAISSLPAAEQELVVPREDVVAAIIQAQSGSLAGRMPLMAKQPARSRLRSLGLAAILLLALALCVPLATWGLRRLSASATPTLAVLLEIQTASPEGVVASPESAAAPPGSVTYLPMVFNQASPLEQAVLSMSPNPTVTESGLSYPPYTIEPPTPQPTETAHPGGGGPQTSTGAAGSCSPPSGWIPYTVRPDDSLPLIAAAAGVNPEELRSANCMEGSLWLNPGEVIYVPRLPSFPATTSQAGAAASQTAQTTPEASGGTVVTSTPASTTGTALASPAGVVSTPLAAPAPAGCLEFDDLPQFGVYGVGESFQSASFPVTVNGFVNSGGAALHSGVVEVVSGLAAGGNGQELLMDNASLSFALTDPAAGLTLLFNEYAGSLNIEINGEFRNFSNFADLHQETIAGVRAQVVGGQGDGRGSLELSGPLRTFRLGGQELWVDQVCFK